MAYGAGTITLHPGPHTIAVERAERRRAIVTGGAGFIGSHLCEMLLFRGFEVQCLDDFSTGSPENIANLMGSEAFTVTHCNVVEGLPAQPADIVFHCALPGYGSDHVISPMSSIETLSTGTLRALDFAHTHGCRFVLVSSSDVYGGWSPEPLQEHTFAEIDPSDPADAYVESRRFSETLTAAHRAFLGVDTAIVRVFNAYGPRMRSDGDGLVSRFIRSAIERRPMLIPGSGTHNYALCYVGDIVKGILGVAFGNTPGPVNLGDCGGLPVAALAFQIAAIAQSDAPVEYITFPATPPRVRRPDVRIAEHLFGWRATTSLAEGLSATIAAARIANRIPA